MTSIYYLTVAVSRELRSSLAGEFWLRVSREVADRMSVRAAAFEGLMRAGGASFKMAHSTWLLARGPDFLVIVAGVLTSSPHRTFLGTCRVFTHHGIWLPPE